MSRLFAVLAVAGIVLSVSPVYAQALASSVTPAAEPRFEIGLKAAIGPFNYGDGLQPGNRTSASVEACLLCGRRALVFEYSHWSKPSASYPTAYRSADTFTGALRFQGRQRRARPYVDVGAAIGNARWSTTAFTTAGGMVGAGLTVSPSGRFYLRFSGCLLLMSEFYVGIDAAVGAGWRL